ncbi:MAG: elongation factor G [Spirochaetota bacterium]|nr:elongation factor G [Spirochaetota bacterium]
MPFQKIRNIGIAAHIDAGKTTLTERMLYFTGTTRKIGEVHNGQATMDFMKQEQERGITIASASISCKWNEYQINIIDTPGHVDFTVEVERSLRVIDGMIALFCAVAGVEPQSETVWNQADRYKVPRIAFINKMDRIGANFHECLNQMDKYLDANPIALHIPIGSEDNFQGSIDIIRRKAIIFKDFNRIVMDVPAEYEEECERAREFLVEKLADYDEDIMELYVNEDETPADLLIKAAREATLKLLITPVFCGSAYKNKGVQVILDTIIDYLPSPIDVGAVIGMDINDINKSHARHPSTNDPFCALAFKLIHDPYVGQQTFIRIYSGELKTGMKVYNASKEKTERIGRILKIHAKEREDVSHASPGDIVALIGMKYTKTGDTLCDQSSPILLESIFIPPSVIELQVASDATNEAEKLGIALRKLDMEDPSFNVRVDGETNETIISGMGELHLEIIVDRLKSEFGVETITGAPSVAFRETITTESQAETKYVKQTGGKGQYAHCVMRVEPNAGKGFEFIDHIKGGVIPAEFIPSVERGVRSVLEDGVLVGFPIIDVRVVLLDGSFHSIDSSDMAFRTCGELCFKEAFNKAIPILLEPTMKIEINIPDDYIGDVIGDFNKRRGKIESMRRFRKGSQKISGFVPLLEMFGYATQLRNLSSGRANYSMEFDKYLPLDREIQEETIRLLKEKKLKRVG